MRNLVPLIKLLITSFIIILSIFTPVILFAQDKTNKKVKYYKAKVFENYTSKGILYSVTDSAVILSNRKDSNLVLDTIPYNKIHKILLLKKGSGGIGFAIGSLGSAATGFLIALTVPRGTEGTPALMAIGLGVFLAVPIGICGAIIGSNSWKTFYINNEFSQFQLLKEQLIERAYYK